MGIREQLRLYAADGKKRWHTPGHKGALDKFDITEIGADGKLFPSDEIESAQKEAARFYGAEHCRFLAGGSSIGIKAAIMSVSGNVIVPRGRHRCADEGAALARVRLYEIDNALERGIYSPPTLIEVQAAMDKHPDAAAVLLVTPDYYGRTVKREVINAVKRAGKLLICDSAHGAHFAARPDLFENNYSGVADFCVMSAHKTMDALTQTAYLCVNRGGYIGKADSNLKLLGTTSPSYLLLSSLENAVAFAKENAVLYDKLKIACDRFRQKVRCMENDDFTRLVLDAAAYGLSGEQMFQKLYGAGHCAEMYDKERVVFIVTLRDTPEEIDSLADSISRIVN